MSFPNFIVLGAAKTGTTSLYDYLGQHPHIFMPERSEPSFFAHMGERLNFSGPGDEEWKFVTSLEDYHHLFAGSDGFAAVGEISPRYMYFEKSAGRMAAILPDVRLIAILRHPVERAYSHFLMNKGRNCEPAANLPEAIELEEERWKRGWGWDWQYVGTGLYYKQLMRYYEYFPAQQIKILFYEDYRQDPSTFFSEICRFIGVDPTFRPDMSRKRRQASLPRSFALQKALERGSMVTDVGRHLIPHAWRPMLKARLRSWNARAPERLGSDLRDELFRRHFEMDWRRLEGLLGRPLPL